MHTHTPILTHVSHFVTFHIFFQKKNWWNIIWNIKYPLNLFLKHKLAFFQLIKGYPETPVCITDKYLLTTPNYFLNQNTTGVYKNLKIISYCNIRDVYNYVVSVKKYRMKQSIFIKRVRNVSFYRKIKESRVFLS